MKELMWGIFYVLPSSPQMAETESGKLFQRDGLGIFDNLADALSECEKLNYNFNRSITEKLVSQCGYSIERALECVSTITPRYFVEKVFF